MNGWQEAGADFEEVSAFRFLMRSVGAAEKEAYYCSADKRNAVGIGILCMKAKPIKSSGSCTFENQRKVCCLGRIISFLRLQRGYHVDMTVFAGDHQADDQGNAEGQKNADEPCGKPERQLQFIFGRQRGEEKSKNADPGGDSHRNADDCQPKILTDEQPSDLRVPEPHDFQRRHFPVSRGLTPWLLTADGFVIPKGCESPEQKI